MQFLFFEISSKHNNERKLLKSLKSNKQNPLVFNLDRESIENAVKKGIVESETNDYK